MQYLYIIRRGVLITGIIRRSREWSPGIWPWQFSLSGCYRYPSLQRMIAISVRIRGCRLVSHSVVGRNTILIPAHIRTATAATIACQRAATIHTTITLVRIITPVRIACASTATIIHASIHLIYIDIDFLI